MFCFKVDIQIFHRSSHNLARAKKTPYLMTIRHVVPALCLLFTMWSAQLTFKLLNVAFKQFCLLNNFRKINARVEDKDRVTYCTVAFPLDQSFDVIYFDSFYHFARVSTFFVRQNGCFIPLIQWSYVHARWATSDLSSLLLSQSTPGFWRSSIPSLWVRRARSLI